jgi:hypothetical protein
MGALALAAADPQFQFAPFFFRSCFRSWRRDFFLPLARVCAPRVFQAMTSCFFSVPSARIFAACTSRCKFYRHAVFAFCGAGVLQRRDPGGGRACGMHKTMQTPAGRTFSCSPVPEGHRGQKQTVVRPNICGSRVSFSAKHFSVVVLLLLGV